MKLELKHLAPYLPYGLMINCDFQDGDILSCKMECLSEDEAFLDGCDWDYKNGSEFKPILRPLSDLTKEIEIGGDKFVPIVKLAQIVLPGHEWRFGKSKRYAVNKYGHTFELDEGYFNFLFDDSAHINQFEMYQKLYEWHFDIHNLIENNLAININKI